MPNGDGKNDNSKKMSKEKGLACQGEICVHCSKSTISAKNMPVF